MKLPASKEMIHSRHIAIVGGSGSGKTRLAERLCTKLGGLAARLSLDDFYHDLSALEPSARDRVNFDDPAAIDWKSVRRVMDELSRGRTAQVPVYDFATHSRLRKTTAFAPHPLVLWDGLWLLHPARLRTRFVFSIFVGCESEVRFRRRCTRDVRERGRSLASVQRQFAGQVQPMHDRFVEPQKRHAIGRVSSPMAAREVAELASVLRQLCEPAGQPGRRRLISRASPKRQGVSSGRRQ